MLVTIPPASRTVGPSGPKGSRRNKFTFWRERRAGRCEAPRRSRCRTSSRSGNKADARPPPRPSGLRPAGLQQNVKLFLREPLGSVNKLVGRSKDEAVVLWDLEFVCPL